MNPAEFIHKWQHAELSEHSACHEHFLDLCALVGHPTPAEADKTGESFTFERGVQKHGGGHGWADVWKKGCFGWEYKKKRADLAKAYDQLLLYKEALDNPPLLVVCDMDVIEVHTQFVNAPTKVHPIPLARMDEPRSLEILRAVFHDPDKLKPGQTSEAITGEAAQRIGDLAQRLRGRGEDPHEVARFLDRLVFCMFAEDLGLLSEGMFTGLLAKRRSDPGRFGKVLARLFEAMAEGGDFGAEEIRRFDGNLFSDAAVLELAEDELDLLWQAAKLDWSAVDPSIFGTLFERGLDPSKRAQLGAHYTSREDIETLVEPVVMQPLRRQWDELRQTVENLLATGKKHGALPPDGAQPPSAGENGKDTQSGATVLHDKQKPPKPPSPAVLRKARREAGRILQRFLEDLSRIKVLDPACGSGNFLYVTLQKLKDLEKQVILYAGERGLGSFLPYVGPWQLYGIEINPYAHELAQMTVWIGWLQWTRHNGFGWPQDPVLRPMDNFECKDAILDLSDGVDGAQPPSAGENAQEPQPGATVLRPQRGAAVLHDAIAQAAAELDRLRTNWLNPPEWTKEEVLEFPGSVDGPWARYIVDRSAADSGDTKRIRGAESVSCPRGGIGTVRYPRLVPADDEAAKALKKRTLTNLYNARPTWLDQLHKALDEAVFAAYGWSADLSDEEILEKLLALNLERSR